MAIANVVSSSNPGGQTGTSPDPSGNSDTGTSDNTGNNASGQSKGMTGGTKAAIALAVISSVLAITFAALLVLRKRKRAALEHESALSRPELDGNEKTQVTAKPEGNHGASHTDDTVAELPVSGVSRSADTAYVQSAAPLQPPELHSHPRTELPGNPVARPVEIGDSMSIITTSSKEDRIRQLREQQAQLQERKRLLELQQIENEQLRVVQELRSLEGET